jgi:hypothetical protein
LAEIVAEEELEPAVLLVELVPEVIGLDPESDCPVAASEFPAVIPFPAFTE